MAGSMGRGRWSAAVREAFLAALAQQGRVKHACAAVGLAVASAYQLRGRDPDFAAGWDAALERAREARAARQSALVPRNPLLPDYRIRRDGWTEARQKIFLRALGETGCVRDACARAAISSVSAYRLRGREPDFARAWQRAIDKAMPTIQQAAFARAVEGWDEVVTRNGQELSRRRRYSDSLLRLLIQRGDLDGKRAQAAAGAEPEPARQRSAGGRRFVEKRVATEEETNAVLLKKLSVLERQVRERQDRVHAARCEAQWRQWRECWRRWGVQAAPRPPLLLTGPDRDPCHSGAMPE